MDPRSATSRAGSRRPSSGPDRGGRIGRNGSKTRIPPKCRRDSPAAASSNRSRTPPAATSRYRIDPKPRRKSHFLPLFIKVPKQYQCFEPFQFAKAIIPDLTGVELCVMLSPIDRESRYGPDEAPQADPPAYRTSIRGDVPG